MRRAHEPEGWREAHAAQRDKGIRKRIFTVVGTTKVAGKSQGETVELEMPSDVIDVLIQAGCIEEQGFTIKTDDIARLEDQAGPTAERRATRARNTRKGE